MKDDRTIALEQIVADLEQLSVEDQIWLVERLTDRILIQMDQPQMSVLKSSQKVESTVSNLTPYTEDTHRFDMP